MNKVVSFRIDGFELTHCKSKRWQERCEIALFRSTTNKLIDLDLLDTKFVINSFHSVDLVFAQGRRIMWLRKFNNLSFLFKFKFSILSLEFKLSLFIFSFKSYFSILDCISIIESLLLFEELSFEFLNFELFLSLETFYFELVLLLIINGLLSWSLHLLIVTSLLLFGAVKLFNLGNFHIWLLSLLVNFFLCCQINLLCFQTSVLSKLGLKINEQLVWGNRDFSYFDRL